MQRKLLLLLIACLPAMAVSGQGKIFPSLELQVKPSVNYNIGLTKVLNGGPTDHLLGYDDRTWYLQVIGLSLFFHKHWGIDFNLQSIISNRRSWKAERFGEQMKAAYNDHYFVDPFSSSGYYYVGGAIQRGHLGLIYRLESNRFFMHPKLSLGITSFDIYNGRSYLKEKESNIVLEVYYLANKHTTNHFTVGASTAFGYKLCRWLYFNVDLQTSWYKTNIRFTKTITDLESGQNTSESIHYKKHVFNLGLGAGLIFSIK